MKIGYIRVSTLEQNPARQEALMKELGVEITFLDKASGKDTHRPELQKMLDFVREGDTVYVEAIDRFARNSKDLMNLVGMLNDKGVKFVSHKEPILNTGTPFGKMALELFGAMAELERAVSRERQAEGIAIAKAQGKYKGRKPIEIDPDLLERIHTQWYKGEITSAYAMKKLGVSRATFYKRMWEYEDERGIARKNGKEEK